MEQHRVQVRHVGARDGHAHQLPARSDGDGGDSDSGATDDGYRLRDGRASYGIGLETFALGFPIHFDWTWRTTFNKAWEDVLFASSGGSAAFRKPRFQVWIGYDF